MSNMTEQDKMRAEQFARRFLWDMKDKNFSLEQQKAVVKLMEKELSSKSFSDDQVKTFESQLAELEASLKKIGFTAKEWLIEVGKDDSILGALKVSGLRSLATHAGVTFLKEKFGLNCCPLAVHREH